MSAKKHYFADQLSNLDNIRAQSHLLSVKNDAVCSTVYYIVR